MNCCVLVLQVNIVTIMGPVDEIKGIIETLEGDEMWVDGPSVGGGGEGDESGATSAESSRIRRQLEAGRRTTAPPEAS